MGKLIDLTGQRFGRLKVIKRVPGLKYGYAKWLCICDCGAHIVLPSRSLISGNTKSCGCLKIELSVRKVEKYRKENVHFHGDRDRRLANIWAGMRYRCFSPTSKLYQNYGGRGITICQEWDDFYSFQKWAFSSGYSEHLTIDRIDVNGPYSPENCRWVTLKRQARNKRETIYLTLDGIQKPMADWADEIGVSWSTLHTRYLLGWSDERILTTPVQKHKQK